MIIFNQIYLKILIRLHNNLYHKISHISTKINHNIHPKHRIMNYHKFFLDNLNRNSKVLDIGCGNGILAFDIAKKVGNVIAIDIKKNSVKFAKKYFNRHNIKYILGDASTYQFNEKFDYIILSNVLEHIKERKKFLNTIKYLANFFLIRVPMINRSWLTLYKKELGMEYRLNNSHYIEYTLKSFINEIESVGLIIISYSIQYGELWAIIKS